MNYPLKFNNIAPQKLWDVADDLLRLGFGHFSGENSLLSFGRGPGISLSLSYQQRIIHPSGSAHKNKLQNTPKKNGAVSSQAVDSYNLSSARLGFGEKKHICISHPQRKHMSIFPHHFLDCQAWSADQGRHCFLLDKTRHSGQHPALPWDRWKSWDFFVA